MSEPLLQQDLNFKLTVTPSFEFTSQTLVFDTTSATRSLHREVVCFKDAKVRECLIALGWTPPSDAQRLDVARQPRANEDTP